jgi:hypothetical protein
MRVSLLFQFVRFLHWEDLVELVLPPDDHHVLQLRLMAQVNAS